jgi:hypothetical protein
VIRRLCLGALRLYPDAWRRRYEEEMRAVIEQSKPTPLTMLDLLGGALDAHLFVRLPTPSPRQLRMTVITTAYCWIAFVLVGASFAKATEDAPFRAAEASHALLGGAHVAVIALAVTCGAIVVAAGAPIAVLVLWQVYRGHHELRRALLRACIAVAAFVVATAALVGLANRAHGNGGFLGHLAFLGWGALALIVAAVCALGLRTALLQARLDRPQLVPGIAGAWLLSRLMLALTVAVALYAVALAADAPQAASLTNGPLAFRTTAVLAGQVVVMGLISGVALVTARRGRLAAAS